MFGTSTPTVGQVVTFTEGRWTGNLTVTRSNWTWNLTNAQKTTLQAVLDAINNGTIVMSSGC
jgi:flagellar capping protein FliD